jgi:hypothetical protein
MDFKDTGNGSRLISRNPEDYTVFSQKPRFAREKSLLVGRISNNAIPSSPCKLRQPLLQGPSRKWVAVSAEAGSAKVAPIARAVAMGNQRAMGRSERGRHESQAGVD